ncbi:MAG: hypothetical protein H0W55_06540 [Actinobacteria bacterium]|jgi:hypothetical protein|nr:hypothetical protein [Actinomycetota bacterium]MDQ3532614.1 hypothetical protein [Actinomycetota bacterium]
METIDFEDRISSILQRAEGSDDATRLGSLEEVAQRLEAELEGALEMARPADDVGAARPA